MIYDNRPNQILSQTVISMDEVVACVNYASGRGNGNARTSLQDAIHRFADYRNLPLDRASETDILTKNLEFSRSCRTE